VLTSEQIMGLLPHRYPFALVDRVLEHEPGVRAVAGSMVSASVGPLFREISYASAVSCSVSSVSVSAR
jgi:hypothetical protein